MNGKLYSKLALKLIHTKNSISDRNSNRIGVFLLLILLILSWILTQAVQIYATNPKKLQEGIASEIVRFHVIANSDSDEDQHLKYQVKDTLVQSLHPYLKDVKDINEAQNIINEQLPYIRYVAEQVIEENGYSYPVIASLSACYFPMKVYGEYTFPPGTYDALQVRIGDAQGQNWWCVMFPPLCFVDETYSIIDEDSEEKLKHLLTEEEFEELKNSKVPIKIKFKLLEAIKKLFE